MKGLFQNDLCKDIAQTCLKGIRILVQEILYSVFLHLQGKIKQIHERGDECNVKKLRHKKKYMFERVYYLCEEEINTESKVVSVELGFRHNKEHLK